MCGIVAVLTRPSLRPPPRPRDVEAAFARARAELVVLEDGAGTANRLKALRSATQTLTALDASLRGVPGLRCLLGDPRSAKALERGAADAEALAASFDKALDTGGVIVGADELEELNSALVGLQDAIWALGHDRLEAARSVSALAYGLGPAATEAPAPWPGPAAVGVLWAVHVALRSLDRLEVRGRDSAGLHLMLSGHGLDFSATAVRALMAARTVDPMFTSLAARVTDGCLSVVYKTAAEIGELGDNVAALRQALGTDPLLAMALLSPGVRATVVGHTRWASAGLISQANAHPLNSDEVGRCSRTSLDGPRPYVIGALNGDVDNYARLVSFENITVPPEVTTDAKIVPALVSRHLAAGGTVGTAFRAAVARLEGSVGIVANASCAPDELYLAQRGSGQSLNIGLAEDAFVVASEPYGLVEETRCYVRMHGDDGGQVIRCRGNGAGTRDGVSRWGYDGSELPVSEADVMVAEVTTRDVDRRGFSHFLLKEISESPGSVRKTLRGKLTMGEDGHLVARLGEDVIPPMLSQALSNGGVHHIVVIGQGTAAVAGQAVAAAITKALPSVGVTSMPASELSGWGPFGAGLSDDMSTTLVVAISQSGTTTDTNRTVDLLRARGAHVVAIVNRRNSDLVQKAHGVLYTSDGRDVEMSVASTKAFFSQVAAGHLLALALAAAGGVGSTARSDEILSALRELPSLMEKLLEQRPGIAKIASALAPSRRSWAVVGSGPDRTAAAEVRIKLSELCYKAIALDAVEDKKHIDLSAEPLIIVCATSASDANARDIAKEINIFRAHKAAPVVIVSEAQVDIFDGGVDLIAVPTAHPELAFLLAAMTGHIFGYEAALSIDAGARPFREARALLERVARGAGGGPDLDELAPVFEIVTRRVLADMRSGACDGSLNASTAARLTSLVCYATGALPVQGYEAEMGKLGTPSAIATDLVIVLGAAIDELTRPVDAIKHQAKTVTVGTSRSEEALFGSLLVAETMATGASLDSLGYRALRTLAALSPVTEEVLGYTHYDIEPATAPAGAGALEGATISVVNQGGVARGITSRTVGDNRLRGTKHRAAEKREVTVFHGLHDGRTGIMVPLVKDDQVTGISLLHARFAAYLRPGMAKAVLQGYQGRYTALVDAVTEAQSPFDDEVLGRLPMIELLTEPVAVLAQHWSTSATTRTTGRGPGPRDVMGAPVNLAVREFVSLDIVAGHAPRPPARPKARRARQQVVEQA
jgi:glutamine---fructose-6-phosphate transaminase (isomerizing)